jgi:hypothetical protein
MNDNILFDAEMNPIGEYKVIIDPVYLQTIKDNNTKRNLEFLKEQNRTNLNAQRDKELQELTINNISCTELNVFKMAVKFNVMADTDTANWIDIGNFKVTLSKSEFGALIAQGTAKIEEVYFRYRQLKDN